MEANKANIDRFSGFAGLYDENRPKPPETVVSILLQYLNGTPEVVVDLGAGTGLSTFLWQNHAGKVIGIEPNDDMRSQAARKGSGSRLANVSFIKAVSHETGLESGIADIVTCSQSFHWMEPGCTLKEIARILKEGGIFAAYDCDWPTVAGSIPEMAYNRLLQYAREKQEKLRDKENSAVKYPKEKHLDNIIKSGYFRYAREIVFHNREDCSAERFVNIALSQGEIQTVYKRNPDDIRREVEEFRETVLKNWTRDEMIVCYRMRIGIK